MTFDPETALSLLVCPKSHAPLVHEDGRLVSTDPDTRLRYPIRDGIPVLLIDEADEVEAGAWAQIMQRHGRDPQNGKLPETNAQTE